MNKIISEKNRGRYEKYVCRNVNYSERELYLEFINSFHIVILHF